MPKDNNFEDFTSQRVLVIETTAALAALEQLIRDAAAQHIAAIEAVIQSLMDGGKKV